MDSMASWVSTNFKVQTTEEAAASAALRENNLAEPRSDIPDRNSANSLDSGVISHHSQASAVSTVSQSRTQHLKALTKRAMSSVWSGLFGDDEEAEAPLHVFEAKMKRPVDFGMFFFGLANAGVAVDAVGGVTWAVVISLLVGKTIGIAIFSLFAVMIGFGLPDGLTYGDLVAMSALAGVGLTVALFLANEAFQAPELKGQAKMGAVLSLGCFIFSWCIRLTFGSKKSDLTLEEVVVLRRTSTMSHASGSLISDEQWAPGPEPMDAGYLNAQVDGGDDVVQTASAESAERPGVGHNSDSAGHKPEIK
jgi:hypothetical protein